MDISPSRVTPVGGEWWLPGVFFPLRPDQIIWTDPGEWKWVREGQAMVPCFSLPSNVIRALKDVYGLDSNPHRSLIRLRHLSLSLIRLISHQCRCLSFSLFFLHPFLGLQIVVDLFPLAAVWFLNNLNIFFPYHVLTVTLESVLLFWKSLQKNTFLFQTWQIKHWSWPSKKSGKIRPKLCVAQIEYVQISHKCS